jgi:methylated-DNA-[protein]-cysteine S-methyltransferase
MFSEIGAIRQTAEDMKIMTVRAASQGGARKTSIATALGTFTIREEGGFIVQAEFSDSPIQSAPAPEGVLGEAARQLEEYFCGRRQAFDLPLQYGGTPFQRAVWEAVLGIPYGEVRTYEEIAQSACSPNATGPAASGCAANPLPVLIPCHRVVAREGKLGGYAFGVAIKRKILSMEGFKPFPG